jgi:hypothetical protein
MERSPLLDPVLLKDSAAGTSMNGDGKLVGAAEGDLVTGIVSTEHSVSPAEMDMPTQDMSSTIPEPAFGGFLGRSHGWDR